MQHQSVFEIHPRRFKRANADGKGSVVSVTSMLDQQDSKSTKANHRNLDNSVERQSIDCYLRSTQRYQLRRPQVFTQFNRRISRKIPHPYETKIGISA